MAHFGAVWSGNDGAALAICVFFLIPFTGLYVALGGLWGVLWTDLFQFVLKMSIVIAVAYFAVVACGGMSAMLASLRQMQANAGANAANPLGFFPDFSRGLDGRAAVDGSGGELSGVHRACSGGRSGIRGRSRAAAATLRSASSARATRSRGCSRCCGSTSRIMPFGRGRGSSPGWRSSCCIPGCSIPRLGT